MDSKNANVLFHLFSENGDLVYSDKFSGGSVNDLPAAYGKVFSQVLKKGEYFEKKKKGEFGGRRIAANNGRNSHLIIVYEKPCDEIYKQLHEAQNRIKELEAIMESSHDGIVVADADGVLLAVNDNYIKSSGLSRDQVIGRSVYSKDMKKLFSPSGTAMTLKHKKTITLCQNYAGGRQSIVTSSPVFDSNGKIFRVVTNVRDMTEINKLRQELDDAMSKLDESSKQVERLSKQVPIFNHDIFNAPSMTKLYEKAQRFAQVEAPILITGASGVGKEVLANFIHQNSNRAKGPFIKINCGAIPADLLESEFFGYEEGAFTGAKRTGRIGLFEAASDGSLLLDEIGELPLHLQVKLLRFVQHKEFFRVGGSTPKSVDVRIIAATNRDLEKMVEEASFRKDLYYRLNIILLHIPDLFQRREDIIPMAHFFLKKFNEKYQVEKHISQEVYHIFENYHWDGNIRELENVVERLVIASADNVIKAEHLPPSFFKPAQPGQQEMIMAANYREALESFEKNFWRGAIGQYGSCRQAAIHMGVDPSTVIKKAARYKIDVDEAKESHSIK